MHDRSVDCFACVLELVYSGDEMAPFARDFANTGPPFCWHDARRAQQRAELDAAFLHIHGVGRADAEYILDTFPIVHRNDVKRFGVPLTRRLVLDVYDALAEAAETGAAFESPLHPPSGFGPRHSAGELTTRVD